MSAARSSPLCSLPSVTAMFELGPPCLQTLHATMEDIDRQLSENDKSIEDTLRRLVQATNSLSADNDYTNVKDAMDSLTHTPVLEECACLTPEPEDVSTLLRTVLQQLTRNPGCEPTVFNQLLYLSSHEGLGLPVQAPELDHINQSASSLNMATDSADENNDLLWEEVRSRLRRHYLEGLQQLPLGLPHRPPGGAAAVSGRRRVEYLQSLCILYPLRKVWGSYRLLRSQQVMTLIQDVMTPAESDECITDLAETKPIVTLDLLAARLSKLVECVQSMVEEDFNVMLANVFDGQVEASQALGEIYLCSLSEELQVLLERAWEVKGNSNEEEVALDRKHGGKRSKGNAVGSSLFGDDHEMEEGDAANISIEDIPPLTQEDLLQLVTITEQLSGLDAHLQALHQQASRDNSAMMKQCHSKRRIKSALKNSRDSAGRESRHAREYVGRKGAPTDTMPSSFGVAPAGMVTQEGSSQRRHTVPDSPITQNIKWEWTPILEGVVSDMCTSLPSLVLNVRRSAINQLDMMYSQCHTIDMVPVCGDLISTSSGYPKCAAKSIVDLATFLDSILPLAISGAEGILKPVRTAYIEAVSSSMNHFHSKLSDMFQSSRSHKSNSDTNISEKYMVLATAAFATSYLKDYEDLLTDEEWRYSLSSVKQQYDDLSSFLKDQILVYHSRTISTVILQDAESHHWADQRAFYEDERCSFSVQMWHLHLDAVRQQLFSVCPPGLTQEIFASIVGESLSLLARRYNKAKPSYKRVRQFRSDITAILLITLDHLWYLTPSASSLLDPLSAHQPSSDIHNSCTALLSALTVGGSPLEDLHRVYKKGFSQRRVTGGSIERTISEQEAVGGSTGLLSLAMTPSREWMRWIHPGLFEGLHKGVDNLPDNPAAYIHLKLLHCQPCLNCPLLLQTLMMRNYLVPTLIVTNTGPTQSQTGGLNSMAAFDGCGGGMCAGKPCRSSQSREIPSVVQPIVDLLVLCGDQPNALTNVLTAMIEKEGNWDIFDAGSSPDTSSPVPPWLASVYNVISSYINRAIEPAIAILLKEPVDVSSQCGFIEAINELPCGCRLKQKAQILQATGPQEDIFIAVQALITTLADNVSALPTTLCLFFNSLQQRLVTNDVHCAHDCIGLQVIANCVYNKLHDSGYLSEVIGVQIDPVKLDDLYLLGNYCHKVLTASSTRCRDSFPLPLCSFVSQHTDWLHSKIDTIISHMDNDLFSNCSGYPLDKTPSQFLEHTRQMQASLIFQAPHGEKCLLQVYNMLTNNLEWFEHHLEIPPVLKVSPVSPDPPDESPIFSLDLTTQSHRPQFNPLVSFNSLGGSAFDQAAIAAFPYNWTRLLQCELGMSEVGFRTLLSHRHEMQDGAYLEENEKKSVRALRVKYDLEVAGE